MQSSVKEDRERYIGGSDIPVILGISSFKKRFDLLKEKCGLKVDNFEGNIYTEYGNRMESVIREWINVECEDISCRVHTDGEDDDTILEIKTTSHVYENLDDYEVYLSQILYYMVTEEKKYGLLAVYERPEDLSEVFDPDRLHLYTVELVKYNDFLLRIDREVEKFLRDRLKMIENPFISEEELMPTDVSVIAQKMFLLEQRLKEYNQIEEEYKKQKESLLAAMNANNVKSFKTESGILITAVPKTDDTVETKTVFDEKRFSEEHPRVYKKYSEVKESVKSGRKGYLKITYPKEEE